MRQYFVSSLLLSVMYGSAQITIGPNDMPSAGDTMRYRTTNAGNVSLALTGAGVTWDYSTLTLGAEGADTAVTVASTPLAYQLFFNNAFLYPDHAANFALKGVEFGFQAFSFEDVYDYYKRNAAGYRNVGFGANLNGIPTSIRRIPVDYIHRFPLNFGNMDTSFSSFNVNVPTIGYYKQDQTRFNNVDGWGTLILPGNTFEVLRVRSVLQQRDSIYVDQFGFGFATNRPQTVEYKWLAQGMDVPVLIVTTVAGQPTTARFFYDPEPITTTIVEQSSSEEVALWPNPVNDMLHVQLPAAAGGRLAIHDATGRMVKELGSITPGSIERIPTRGLPDGVYTIVLNGVSLHGWRFVVQH
jgi:hypothetical protein